jgi:hypothetical protein
MWIMQESFFIPESIHTTKRMNYLIRLLDHILGRSVLINVSYPSLTESGLQSVIPCALVELILIFTEESILLSNLLPALFKAYLST